MTRIIKSIAKHTFAYRIVKYIRQKIEVCRWERKCRPIPVPHSVKKEIIIEYAKKHNLTIFIETGTYLGDMVYEVRKSFKSIFSIELSKKLCEQAKHRFSRYDHISIYHGDSGKILPEILAAIDRSCLFWLDAHYSGGITAKSEPETPVAKELLSILNHPVEDHIILIDDAHLFNGSNDYLSMDQLKGIISAKRPGWIIEVKDDIVRIYRNNDTQEIPCY